MPRLPRFDGVEQTRLLVELRVVLRSHRGAEADAVGPLHRFDLDHVRAQRGEPRRRERTGPERGEVEHLAGPRADVRRRRRARRAAARAATVAAAGAGATSARSATPWKRNGARGRIQSSPAGGRTRRARRAARSAGARRRCRRSSPARARRRRRQRPRPRSCAVVQARRMAFTSSARLPRPSIVVSSSSSRGRRGP